MRMRNFIPVLLLGWLFTSCVYDAYDPGRCMDATLDITVEFPAVPVLKSEVGEVPGSAAENAIHDLKIWVYTSDDHHAPVTSMTVDASEFPPAGGARRYALHTSRTFAADPPLVDVFILANAASIGCNLKTADTWENVSNTEIVSSWADVHDAVIRAGYFGVASPVHAVPEGGLPMSAMAQSQTVSGSEPFLGLNPLALTRAVSKLRCVFSQMAFNSSNPDALAQISVDKITLNGNQIPLQEYVFTAGDTGIVPGSPKYDATSFELTGPGTEIPSSSTPERYRYVNQDALTYETLLEEGVARGELSHFDGDVTYFRESDLQLTGRIDYSVTKAGVTEQKYKDFSMNAPGDFARNHIWTLYGYFVRDMSLQLSVGVLPWDKQFYSIDFSDAAIWADPKFYVEESTALAAETKDGYRNIYVNRSSPVVAYAPIKTPVGGKLYIRTMGQDDLFEVTPSPFGVINPDVPVKITIGASDKTGSGSITLKFVVEAGGREMLADSELIDTRYRFILP